MNQLQVLGGSSHGITTRQKIVECPRAYWLRKNREEPLRLTGLGADVGTLFHSMADIYHSGGEPNENLPPVDKDGNEYDVAEDTAEEAWRIFRWYRANYSPTYWGEVLATEQLIDSRVLPGLDELMGFAGLGGTLERYTCKLDLHTRMGLSDTALINLNELASKDGTAPRLPGPGRYVLDFKCYKREDVYLREMFGPTNIQLTAYQLAAQYLMGTEDYRGIIVLLILKTREPSLRVIYSPPPGELALAVFESFKKNYAATMERVESEGYFANQGACFNWHKQCYWLGRGCERY